MVALSAIYPTIKLSPDSPHFKDSDPKQTSVIVLLLIAVASHSNISNQIDHRQLYLSKSSSKIPSPQLNFSLISSN